MISKSNMCRFVKVQSRKLNTRKEREKEIEENNKLPWSLSSMYRCVCVMQSSSIERNDTLNCNIERLFFCSSESTVWCDDVLRPCYAMYVFVWVWKRKWWTREVSSEWRRRRRGRKEEKKIDHLMFSSRIFFASICEKMITKDEKKYFWRSIVIIET